MGSKQELQLGLQPVPNTKNPFSTFGKYIQLPKTKFCSGHELKTWYCSGYCLRCREKFIRCGARILHCCCRYELPSEIIVKEEDKQKGPVLSNNKSYLSSEGVVRYVSTIECPNCLYFGFPCLNCDQRNCQDCRTNLYTCQVCARPEPKVGQPLDEEEDGYIYSNISLWCELSHSSCDDDDDDDDGQGKGGLASLLRDANCEM